MKPIKNIISCVVKHTPQLATVRHSLFKNDAISYVGRIGDLKDRSSRRKNLLFSGILNTDYISTFESIVMILGFIIWYSFL